jgi:hypothetical protein
MRHALQLAVRTFRATGWRSHIVNQGSALHSRGHKPLGARAPAYTAARGNGSEVHMPIANRCGSATPWRDFCPLLFLVEEAQS